MTKKNPFDPANWYIGTPQKKTTRPTKKEASLNETIDDSMRGVGKLAVTGVGLTMLFGLSKGFSQMFGK